MSNYQYRELKRLIEEYEQDYRTHQIRSIALL